MKLRNEQPTEKFISFKKVFDSSLEAVTFTKIVNNKISTFIA